METLLKTKDVAICLGVSKNKARTLLVSGAIRSIDIGSQKGYRVLRVRQEWLDAYIDQQTTKIDKPSKKRKCKVNRY